MVNGEAKERVQFRFAPKICGFEGDRLGIGRNEGGPGSLLMLRSLKLQTKGN